MSAHKRLIKIEKILSTILNDIQRFQKRGEIPAIEFELARKNMILAYENLLSLEKHITESYRDEEQFQEQEELIDQAGEELEALRNILKGGSEYFEKHAEGFKDYFKPEEPKKDLQPVTESAQEESSKEEELVYEDNLSNEEIKPEIKTEHESSNEQIEEDEQPVDEEELVSKEELKEEAPEEEKIERQADTASKSLHERFERKSSLNERYSGKNQALADKMQSSPISDLKSAININQRTAFIKELFENDSRAFKKTLDFVNKCKNYSEAKFYLNSEIKPKFNWDNENAQTKEFMNLVYRKFL